MIDRIQWLGHGSFRIEGQPLVYINPWRLARTAFHADVILVSSDQYDHCSPADIEKLCGPETVIIGNDGVAQMLTGRRVTVLRPWQSLNVGRARFTAVPAYTFTNDYPVSQGGLGFVISIDYYDIYYAGNTDLVPELGYIHADAAILPIGAGQGTMKLEHAVELVHRMQPAWVIPSHWDSFGGAHLDVRALARALEGQTSVVTLERIR